MTREHSPSYGACIEHTVRSALKEWRELHHRDYTVVDAVAMFAVEVETVAKTRPGGKLEIVVQITDNKPENCHSLFSRWHRASAGRYTRSQPTLNV